MVISAAMCERSLDAGWAVEVYVSESSGRNFWVYYGPISPAFAADGHPLDRLATSSADPHRGGRSRRSQ